MRPNEKLTGEMKIHMGESGSKIKIMDQSTLPSTQREIGQGNEIKSDESIDTVNTMETQLK